MATVSKSFTEKTYNYEGSRGTWTISITGSDLNVTAASQTVAIPKPTVKVKYVASGRGYGSVEYSDVTLKVPSGNGTNNTKWIQPMRSSGAMTSGTFYTCSIAQTFPWNIAASTLFNSSNPTEKSKAISTNGTCRFDCESRNKADTNWGWVEAEAAYGTIGYVYYKCPPTANVGTPSYPRPYAGLGTYSVNVASATALYGGYIKSIVLTIGTQTDARTYSANVTNETFTITPEIAGTYTPTLTITDSRDQVLTVTLPTITVNPYVAPSVDFDVYRTDSAGVKSDEGRYGLVECNVAYTTGAVTLDSIAAAINGTLTNNVTWYTGWTSATGVDASTEIDGTNITFADIPSGSTIYGLINGSFLEASSYQITVTAADTEGTSSTAITRTLSTAFYTIDVKAGGKEMAFGSTAKDDTTNFPEGLFKCSMAMCIPLDVNSASGLDALIYNTIVANGWTNDVIATDANSVPMVKVKELLAKIVDSI